jgi:hypothetical protein
MGKMIAFCGLDCTTCEAYLATQANNDDAMKAVLEKFRVEYNHPEMTLVDVTCDGCTSSTGRLGAYCSMCEIRACALEKGLANCAYCEAYETCEKLNGFLANVAVARENLEAIRAGM